MEAMPNALLKDLLSTGYFFEDLKALTGTQEIKLSFYSRNYAIPYLINLLEVHRRSGDLHENEILSVAIDSLTRVRDEELADLILELKKAAASEIDSVETALNHLGPGDKRGRRVSRQKSKSAQSLFKLLISIIKVFKLADGPPKREATKAANGVV